MDGTTTTPTKNGENAEGPVSSESLVTSRSRSRSTGQGEDITSALEEGLSIHTHPTESLTDEGTPTTIGTGTTLTFTPTNNNGTPQNMFKTPRDQEIEISYKKLGLSPSSMKRMEGETLKMLDEDGAWSEFDRNNPTVFLYLVFIYGKGFYDELERDDRIEQIKTILSDSDCRDRLRQIAFSVGMYRPKYMRDMNNSTDPFERANNFIESIRALKERDDFHGPGFHGEPFYCKQSSRNCYVPAACNWATLVYRMNNPDLPPLDIGRVARKHDITTRKAFEARVVENRGNNTLEFARSILGLPEAFVHTKNLDFSWHQDTGAVASKREEFEEDILKRLKQWNCGNCGLVSKWKSPAQFSQRSTTIAENLPTQPGILEFVDPYNPNDKGTFKPFELDRNDFEERKKDRKLLYNEQEQKREGKMKEIKKLITRIINAATSELSDGIEEEKKSDDTVDERNPEGLANGSTGGMHSMIMLGYYVKKLEGKSGKGRKAKDTNDRYIAMYVLWNWWETMPLVAVPIDYLMAARCSVSFYDSLALPTPNQHFFCESDRLTLDAQSAYPAFEENCTNEDDGDY